MTTTHLITSAVVGGQTGKTTLALMLTAYLCRPHATAAVIVVLDLSNGALLYDKLYKLAGAPSEDLIDNLPCFVFREPDERKILIVIKPTGQFADQLEQVINIVRTGFPKRFEDIPAITHLVCETNLPTAPDSRLWTVAPFRGSTNSQSKPLHVWTTWNMEALIRQEEYDDYDILRHSIGDIVWRYVHNPFISAAGSPSGDVSLSTKACHSLQSNFNELYTPNQMWEECGFPAKTAASTASPDNEVIWTAAYQLFQQANRRPSNLLPIFRKSKGLERAARNLWENPNYVIDRPSRLAANLDTISDRMYSEVFEIYFLQQGL